MSETHLKSRLLAALAALSIAGVGSSAVADPCGMVPPFRIVEPTAITRVGLQKTYVAYHKGVETMVLRPGFSGKVDEFGMLIPFPSPPAIRKVDENIFSQIAAAIDPPEVVAYVRQPRRWRSRNGRGIPRTSKADKKPGDAPLSFDTVKVVKREAVGMYDVAVLAAGSAKALKRWMDDHGFRYPKGMDKVTQEYVDARWYFVAVKTKVGQKAGVNPRPGMRKANSQLPAGATFNGHVQAMGFRFKSKELVVPMRLSVYNPGELRNVVYILTDGPQRIVDIPKRYVMRQIPGKRLFDNVTKPLPVRVYGGTYKQLTKWQKQSLVAPRNPYPHNGKAKELFASDLLAIQSGRLANPFEEEEKDLLAIGERLGLRGLEIDNLHGQILAKKRDKAVKKALARLKNMTMTVVDGDFNRDVLARENLTMAQHRMPRGRNNAGNYNARQFGPGGNPGGKLYRGASLDTLDRDDGRIPSEESIMPWRALGSTGIGLGCAAIVLGLFWRRRKHARGRTTTPWLLLIIGISAGAAILGAGGTRLAWGQQRAGTSLDKMLAALAHGDTAEQAMPALIALGERAIDPLLDEVVDNKSMILKGWAIVTLSEIGGERVDRELRKLHDDNRTHMLVRTWAAAARVKMAKDDRDLARLQNLASRFPALRRPLSMRRVEILATMQGEKGVEAMLLASMNSGQLRNQLQPVILARGSAPLIDAMVRSGNQGIRRMAAGYLGALPNQGEVIDRVIEVYRFRPKAQQVPWQGGPLFLPSVRWSQKQARTLADHLIRWHLWADLRKDESAKRQIHNNLISLRSAGQFPAPSGQATTVRWLSVWSRVAGKKQLGAILRQQGVHRSVPYRGLLH